MDFVLDDTCRRFNLEVMETFGAGHICTEVYKVRNGQGDVMVLKTGNTSATIGEIRKNLAGYDKLRAIGLSHITPRIFASSMRDDEAYVLMEYCGPDFYTLLESDSDPDNLYLQLAYQLREAYVTSVQVNVQGSNYVSEVVGKVKEQYRRYIQPYFDPTEKLALSIADLPSRFPSGPSSACFASWDLTPRNVFLDQGNLKYVDCNENVLGIPTIDLACFAGVIRDVHALRGCERGYETLESLAIYDVADILSMTIEETQRLFHLGRLLQSLLSARFRVTTEPAEAQRFFSMGCEHLDIIMET